MTSVALEQRRNGDRVHRGVLDIRPPESDVDDTVRIALARLGTRDKYALVVEEIETLIAENGLTVAIERFRDRLDRVALRPLERLLLTQRGVPHLLLFDAIEEAEVRREKREEEAERAREKREEEAEKRRLAREEEMERRRAEREAEMERQRAEREDEIERRRAERAKEAEQRRADLEEKAQRRREKLEAEAEQRRQEREERQAKEAELERKERTKVLAMLTQVMDQQSKMVDHVLKNPSGNQVTPTPVKPLKPVPVKPVKPLPPKQVKPAPAKQVKPAPAKPIKVPGKP